MMYRFYLEVGGGGKKAVTPIYGDDVTIEYEKESGEQFFRAKLTGKFQFVREDYELIKNNGIETEFIMTIQKSEDYGRTWADYHISRFYLTDCTINEDDRIITVQPTTRDSYDDVLAGLDKEYNLIDLKPAMFPIVIDKRPLIQLYVPNDEVVSCFIGGSAWEQDVTEAKEASQLNAYRFVLNSELKEIRVSGSGEPAAAGVYVGKVTINSDKTFNYELRRADNEYYLRLKRTRRVATATTTQWTTLVELVRVSGSSIRYRYTTTEITQTLADPTPFNIMDFTLSAVNGSGSMQASMWQYDIYGRYLMDVEKFNNIDTYKLAAGDIVEDNRNYRRALGYKVGACYISNVLSSEPTEYGMNDDGLYFAPPAIPNKKFYPIARSTWHYSSLWFAFDNFDTAIEQMGRKSYIVNNTYSLASCLSVLLQQFAPAITHEATEEYSQFLYGNSNPLTGQKFRLYVTPKSNVVRGEYQQPAQKAPTTLRAFLTMLKNVYQCYWYIENNKLKIEHILYFKNGGSYLPRPRISADLTQLENVRNGKKWGFGTNEYTFDKQDMPQRYQFSWMDEVTTPFAGLPIEIRSRFINEGRNEDISVSTFTSDIDYMLLNPSEISLDGFALFAAVNGNALADPDASFITSSGTDGLTTPRLAIKTSMSGRQGVLTIRATGGGSGEVVFFREDGTQFYAQGGFAADGAVKTIGITIPFGAAYLAYRAIGTISVQTLLLTVDSVGQLPYRINHIQGEKYTLQNGNLAFCNLQPDYWLYDMPSKNITVNGDEIEALGTMRNKKQTVTYPIAEENPQRFVKTSIGYGEIEKLSVNLSTRAVKATLRYENE